MQWWKHAILGYCTTSTGLLLLHSNIASSTEPCSLLALEKEIATSIGVVPPCITTSTCPIERTLALVKDVIACVLQDKL